ncbi:MAG TPA: AbrB/MazE/SpoVT family DNA-binding domain-containing protein [Thermoanaerobaculia bacterium]|nr:AbrB/MazE/SpoVT family DNA-binding domain-containing protein [Thermoanaerobaculia bacterium]
MKTTLSTKGQLIIPKVLRDRLGWREGTELEVEEQGGVVILRLPVVLPRTTLDQLLGCADYRGPRRTLEDMAAAIERGARE